MVTYTGANVGYTNNSVDIGYSYVQRDYVRDLYPNLTGLAEVPGTRSSKLWGCGYNYYWSLGLGDADRVHRSSPVVLTSANTANANWRSIACGSEHMAAIDENGDVWSWGRNQYGQVAAGLNVAIGQSYLTSPKLWYPFSSTIRFGAAQVSCGQNHTVVITDNFNLWSTGDNTYGQLGDLTITHRSSPVQTVSGGNNWSQVSCGSYSTLAIKTDGTLWAWGWGTSVHANTTTSSPIQTATGGNTWISVAGGRINGAAIKTDGTLWTFAFSTNYISGSNNQFKQLSSNSDWVQCSAGEFNAGAINKKGQLWMIGGNGRGELGDGTRTNNNTNMVQTISGGTNWKKIAINKNSGGASIYAIKTDGTLWSWGDNTYGQLGTGDMIHRSSPVQILGGGNPLWKDVSPAYYNFNAMKLTYTPYSNTYYTT